MTGDARELLARAATARRETRPLDAERDLLTAVNVLRGAGVEPGLAAAGTVTLDLAVALQALGQIRRDLGRLDEALVHYEEATALLRAAGDPLRLAHAVRHIGDIARHLGDVARAEACYAEAIALYRADARTTPLELANALRGHALNSADTARATALWSEAKSLYERAGVAAGVDECARHLAAF